jgi:hypothetical protein
MVINRHQNVPRNTRKHRKNHYQRCTDETETSLKAETRNQRPKGGSSSPALGAAAGGKAGVVHELPWPAAEGLVDARLGVGVNVTLTPPYILCYKRFSIQNI